MLLWHRTLLGFRTDPRDVPSQRFWWVHTKTGQAGWKTDISCWQMFFLPTHISKVHSNVTRLLEQLHLFACVCRRKEHPLRLMRMMSWAQTKLTNMQTICVNIMTNDLSLSSWNMYNLCYTVWSITDLSLNIFTPSTGTTKKRCVCVGLNKPVHTNAHIVPLYCTYKIGTMDLVTSHNGYTLFLLLVDQVWSSVTACLKPVQCFWYLNRV